MARYSVAFDFPEARYSAVSVFRNVARYSVVAAIRMVARYSVVSVFCTVALYYVVLCVSLWLACLGGNCEAKLLTYQKMIWHRWELRSEINYACIMYRALTADCGTMPAMKQDGRGDQMFVESATSRLGASTSGLPS